MRRRRKKMGKTARSREETGEIRKGRGKKEERKGQKGEETSVGEKEAINWNLGMEERSAGRRANHRKLTIKKKKTSRIPTQDELSEEFQKDVTGLQ